MRLWALGGRPLLVGRWRRGRTLPTSTAAPEPRSDREWKQLPQAAEVVVDVECRDGGRVCAVLVRLESAPTEVLERLPSSIGLSPA